MNILVLDDEKEIADLVEVYLKNENYNVFKFYDSKEAIKCIENQKLDFAILDVMIKDVDGFEICKMIRDKGLNFPVIMLTAKIEDKDVYFEKNYPLNKEQAEARCNYNENLHILMEIAVDIKAAQVLTQITEDNVYRLNVNQSIALGF